MPMKTTVLMMTVAFFGLQAQAHDCKGTTNNTNDTANCPTPMIKDCGGVQGCGEEWVDIETVTLEAANGDPIAQFIVAYITENDPSMADKKDMATGMYSKALPNLQQAAKDGNKKACRALAHMYATGSGVEKNPELAKQYMKECGDCCGSSKCQPDGCMTPKK